VLKDWRCGCGQEALALPADRTAASPAAPSVRLQRPVRPCSLRQPLSFPALIADKLKAERSGCSTSVARAHRPGWRAFGPKLQALGIDASESECKRLAGLERNPDISYVAACAPIADKPVDISAGPAAPLIMRMPTHELQRTREIREARLKQASTAEQFRHKPGR